MHWQVSTAKNGEATLQLNNVAIYSKYRPSEDANRWVIAEIHPDVSHYLLIGLGLGYHLQVLDDMVDGKRITVYYFDQEEYTLFKENSNETWWQQSHIQIVNDLNGIDFDDMQLLLPNAWLKAIGEKHPLFSLLEVIKINQVSYKKNAVKMLENFKHNSALGDETIKVEQQNRLACLVAAGPSLNNTVEWLKVHQKDVDIFVVGAALKMLIANGVRPKAAVLSDANDVTIAQFIDGHFSGELYYLSTANSKSILLHGGKRTILYQQGYKLAEQEAEKRHASLIETGGSVGTTTFSLLEQLGYERIVLFGQDLGFAEDNTHAILSTSGRDASTDLFLRKIEANDGSEINTSAMFQVFLSWYNEKMEKTKVKVFNTAVKGAKINNVPLINEVEFTELISH
ncbi:hypothetical protein CSE16_03000 [Solibacillus sp. R5-41]|uniref:motility associated factor glycosyltransferase family protein n=1 Tax=Solibacillus sp. R5-41 TaxID=2048654 RepID=UPI000C1271F5|nr:6-hydroxymethylpterin diphosphokinase MptE-like protein [Solibacillus sp. R5-41]ATP39074.1 hypothetical protein CSE16_03000 [Solibacillus sp. R5-41]